MTTQDMADQDVEILMNVKRKLGFVLNHWVGHRVALTLRPAIRSVESAIAFLEKERV